MMKICGQNIRKIRRSKDLTQEYMAFEMGISQKHIPILRTQGEDQSGDSD